jgi:hypothetical protein
VILALLLPVLVTLAGDPALAAASASATPPDERLHHHPAADVALSQAGSAPCVPRPPVAVSTTTEDGRLRVTVSATPSPAAPSNRLEAVRFGGQPNARVVSADQGTFSTARVVPLAPPVAAYAFEVERIAPGSITVLLTVTDACGDWSTFVGVGPAMLPAVSAPPATPTPVPPPTGSIEGVPVCAGHDPTGWHPLVERDAAGQVACTYGHEHKDDPRALDDRLGPLRYGEVGHPWETLRENATKHNVYAWYVVRDQPCIAPLAAPALGKGFTDLRVQVHADGHAGP